MYDMNNDVVIFDKWLSERLKNDVVFSQLSAAISLVMSIKDIDFNDRRSMVTPMQEKVSDIVNEHTRTFMRLHVEKE
jgi:hypothetical protein